MSGSKHMFLSRKEKQTGTFDEQLLKIMLHNKYQGVIVINALGMVSQFSECMNHVLYHPSGQVLGKPLSEVCGHPGFRRLIEVLQTGVPLYQKQEQVEGRIAMVDLLPVTDQGKTLGAVARMIFINQQAGDMSITNMADNRSKLKKPETSAMPTVRFTADQIMGASPQMIDLKETIYKVSPRNSTILITGESGTGKELFAQAVHAASLRRYGPLVKINCAAIPDNLMESELFGYEEGAFTGGKKGGQKGKLEMAHGGTVFFDEIGELSFPLQAKLLRFLQEREIHKLGSNGTVTVDVRVVAATNVHLEQFVKYKKFRDDLYYRLNVVNLLIPPLRERREDIPELVKHFIEKFNRAFKMKVKGADREVLRIFLRHPWPGNVRELENVIERAFNVIEGDTILLKHLSDKMAENCVKHKELVPPNESRRIEKGTTLTDIMDETEKKVIQEALTLSGGNKSKASELLGITRPCLYKKMTKYDLFHS